MISKRNKPTSTTAPKWSIAEPAVNFRNNLDVAITKEEVEDEVLKAVHEAKEAKETEEIDEPCVTAISPELYAIVQPTRQEILKSNKVLVHQLRKLDGAGQRTCGMCMRRRPMDMYRRLERSEVCEDCEE